MDCYVSVSRTVSIFLMVCHVSILHIVRIFVDVLLR